MGETEDSELEDLFSFSTNSHEDENKFSIPKPMIEPNTDAQKEMDGSIGSGSPKSGSGSGSGSDMGSGQSGVQVQLDKVLSDTNFDTEINDDDNDSFLDILEDGDTTKETKTTNVEMTNNDEDEDEDEDGFEQHDAGTRNFLEWLDMDGNEGSNDQKKNQTSNDSSQNSAFVDVDKEAATGDDDDLDIDLDFEAEMNVNVETDDNQDLDLDLDLDLGLDSKMEKDSITIEQNDNKNTDSTDFDFEKEVLGESFSQTKEQISSPLKLDIEDIISNPSKLSASPNTTEDTKQTEKQMEEQFEELDNSPQRTFLSLEEAIISTDATKLQITKLFKDQKQIISNEDRPKFWYKLLCSKPIHYASSSSIGDSFQEWRENAFDKEFQDCKFHNELDEEAYCYAQDISKALVLHHNKEKESTEYEAVSKLSLLSLLLFYHNSCQLPKELQDNQRKKYSWDPLLLPVASTILGAGFSDVATSVILASIFPVTMPLMALSGNERFIAAKSLHIKFYLLACYHLPLLILHLDKYVPGWYWPKKPQGIPTDDSEDFDDEGDDNATKKGRNLDAYGAIPISWFVTLFADKESLQFPEHLHQLWDMLLTHDYSLKYFIALCVLQEHSDSLLLLQGAEVEQKIHEIMSFQSLSSLKSNIEMQEKNQIIQEWCKKAQILADSTPNSISQELCEAEDEALTLTLLYRRKIADEKLQLHLDKEAYIHRKAEVDELKRQEEATQKALTKAQLISFYQKYNPEKVDTIDLILEQFKGRYDQLDGKLKKKYGHGFRISITAKTNQFIASMNQNLNTKKIKNIVTIEAFNNRFIARSNSRDEEWEKANKRQASYMQQVAVQVSPADILPSICASKSININEESESSSDTHIQFYLIDSRPEETARTQGRFPKAISISPETLLDPDLVQKELDMFESLRGTVHICVMGEGFGSLPTLYHHQLNSQEKELAEEDESRTSMCALFFIKKGFPFVSTLKGGFAGAHAWLVREGPYSQISSVLIDYDEKFSQLARLESYFKEFESNGSSTSKSKAKHAIKNFLESSMTSLSVQANKIDEYTFDVESHRKVKESVNAFFTKTKKATLDLTNDSSDSENNNPNVNSESKMMKFSDISLTTGWKKVFTTKVKPIDPTKENEAILENNNKSSEVQKKPESSNWNFLSNSKMSQFKMSKEKKETPLGISSEDKESTDSDDLTKKDKMPLRLTNSFFNKVGSKNEMIGERKDENNVKSTGSKKNPFSSLKVSMIQNSNRFSPTGITTKMKWGNEKKENDDNKVQQNAALIKLEKEVDGDDSSSPSKDLEDYKKSDTEQVDDDINSVKVPSLSIFKREFYTALKQKQSTEENKDNMIEETTPNSQIQSPTTTTLLDNLKAFGKKNTFSSLVQKKVDSDKPNNEEDEKSMKDKKKSSFFKPLEQVMMKNKRASKKESENFDSDKLSEFEESITFENDDGTDSNTEKESDYIKTKIDDLPNLSSDNEE